MDEATREIPYADTDIAAVRRYANARASESSVRRIAGQVGMGHTSLGKFLKGSEPFPRNRTLLCESGVQAGSLAHERRAERPIPPRRAPHARGARP
jgi:hypothetical protein